MILAQHYTPVIQTWKDPISSSRQVSRRSVWSVDGTKPKICQGGIILRRFARIAGYAHVSDLPMPERKTGKSAGYDLSAAETVSLDPGNAVLVPTGVKVYMEPDEVLLIFIRSSLAVKHHLILANQVGVIDGDYVDNPDNEGQILVPLLNWGTEPVVVQRGERIAQAIFVRFAITDDDRAEGDRSGGFGSTGR